MPLLDIKNLSLEFGTGAGATRALLDVSLSVEKGETVCLVGESGSGKSITALSIARLLPTPPARYLGGEIHLAGQDVMKLPPGNLWRIRGKTVGYVFQEPALSLNPVMRIGGQILETLKIHRLEAATNAECERLLTLVGIPAARQRLRDYPHQLSGGMQQRVMIAMALAAHPMLLVADEPTTALDVTIQAQILDLLRDLRERLGMSILLITHNLGIVGGFADHVAVMYAGQIVELSPVAQFTRQPLHPYSRALMKSVPQLGAREDRLTAIPGNVPRLGELPPGCRFAPRCPLARPVCNTSLPPLIEAAPNRHVRCPYWSEVL